MSDSTDLVTLDDAGTPAAGAIDELAPAGDQHSASRPSRSHSHPGPRQYVLIAVVLVVITGVEVATSYLEGDVNSDLLIVALGDHGGGQVLPRRRLVHAHEARPRCSGASSSRASSWRRSCTASCCCSSPARS